jgi:hypothetical protein
MKLTRNYPVTLLFINRMNIRGFLRQFRQYRPRKTPFSPRKSRLFARGLQSVRPSAAPYVRIPDGDERKRSPLGGGNARTSGYHYNDGREERQKREGPAVIAGPSRARGNSAWRSGRSVPDFRLQPHFRATTSRANPSQENLCNFTPAAALYCTYNVVSVPLSRGSP